MLVTSNQEGISMADDGARLTPLGKVISFLLIWA